MNNSCKSSFFIAACVGLNHFQSWRHKAHTQMLMNGFATTQHINLSTWLNNSSLCTLYSLTNGMTSTKLSCVHVCACHVGFNNLHCMALQLPREVKPLQTLALLGSNSQCFVLNEGHLSSHYRSWQMWEAQWLAAISMKIIMLATVRPTLTAPDCSSNTLFNIYLSQSRLHITTSGSPEAQSIQHLNSEPLTINIFRKLSSNC